MYPDVNRDVASLQPAIHAILTSPGVDLTTISAKRVRKQLAVQDPSLGEEWIRENKDALDGIIAAVFTEITPPMLTALEDMNGHEVESTAGPSAAIPQRRNRVKAEEEEEEDEDEMEDEKDEEEKATKKKRHFKKTKKTRSEVPMTDAEYAKQLSEELNSRTRSSRSAATKGNGLKKPRGGKAKSRRGPISAAIVDSEGEGDEEEGIGKKRKRAGSGGGGGGGAKGGFSKEYVLSEPLAAVIQVDKLSRPQVVKRLWEYIKGNDLQNPSNRKEIVCDDSLRAVFGQDKIDMFKMNKVLGDHLHEVET